jgi:hypothetical protein
VQRRLFLLATSASLGPALAGQQRILKISALSDGIVLADGKKVDLVSLDKLLAKLKSDEGVVWYFRENASKEPTQQAMEAIRLVVKHSIPVSMSTKPDFSDYVDASGQSKPRQ